MLTRTAPIRGRCFSRLLRTVCTHAPTQEKQDEDKVQNLVRSLSRTSTDINALFGAIDKSGSGAISKEDFDQSMRTIGLDQLRVLQQSLMRNELSRAPSRITKSEHMAIISEDVVPDDQKVSYPQMLVDRTVITIEVMVSKIFPAGFGWQTFSLVAEQQGFAADSMSFALTTGVGDGLAVVVGHTTYMALKKMVVDNTINVTSQLQTGILLGSAAFCSGTAWQPIVNFLSGSGCSFNQTMVGVTAGCGLAFFGGLRAGRLIYSPIFDGVEHSSYGNLKADAALSLSIGGATAAFVGTDISFGDNWLRPVVGVEESMSDLSGCATAGLSTALGFTALQMGQNVAYLQGKNWVD